MCRVDAGLSRHLKSIDTLFRSNTLSLNPLITHPCLTHLSIATPLVLPGVCVVWMQGLWP